MRGTRQGQTIKLRLEGRLLCLWGLLGMEVPWKESQPSPPDSSGASTLRSPVVVLGPPTSLCPVSVVPKVRRLASKSCQDLRERDG